MKITVKELKGLIAEAVAELKVPAQRKQPRTVTVTLGQLKKMVKESVMEQMVGGEGMPSWVEELTGKLQEAADTVGIEAKGKEPDLKEEITAEKEGNGYKFTNNVTGKFGPVAVMHALVMESDGGFSVKGKTFGSIDEVADFILSKLWDRNERMYASMAADYDRRGGSFRGD